MTSWRKSILSSLILLFLLSTRPSAQAAEPGSLVFDKKGHVSCGDIFNVPEGTIEFWFKPASTANNEWVLSKRKDKDNYMDFGFGPAQFMFIVKKNVEHEYMGTPKEAVHVGVWQHAACTFTPDTAVIYINGVKKSTPRPYKNGLDNLQGGEFCIGRGASPIEYFNGSVAAVRLSKVVRYKENFSPPTGPFEADAETVALWNLGEEGDKVSDLSGHGHHGKVVGSVSRSPDSPFQPR